LVFASTIIAFSESGPGHQKTLAGDRDQGTVADGFGFARGMRGPAALVGCPAEAHSDAANRRGHPWGTQHEPGAIFFHPDYTVGDGFAPSPTAEAARGLALAGLPPIGNCTLP
jgi:hypothetical protein